jgi:Kelch motif
MKWAIRPSLVTVGFSSGHLAATASAAQAPAAARSQRVGRKPTPSPKRIGLMADQTAARINPRRRRQALRRLAVVLAPLIVLVWPTAASARPSAPAPVSGADAGPAAGWIQRPPLQYPRFGLGVATVGGRILAIGGFDSDELFDVVESREASGPGGWHAIAPLNTARTNLGTATLDGIVYAVGGYDATSTLDVVETFDPRTGSWSRSAHLPQPRGGTAAAALGGLLYVAGGFISAPGIEETTASVIAYDPRKQTWRSVAPMPTARELLRLVTAGPYLYAVGGLSGEGNSLTTIERYDPKSNRWQTVSPMHESRVAAGITAANIDGRQVLVAVGGAIWQDFEILGSRRTTEVYDLATGRWQVLRAELPEPRGSLGCATEADGTVLAIGGGSSAGPIAEVLALKLTRLDLAGQ